MDMFYISHSLKEIGASLISFIFVLFRILRAFVPRRSGGLGTVTQGGLCGFGVGFSRREMRGARRGG